ncbi:survival motor neuron protein-like isoform X2 [Xiphias gladius]|uniref:survival motor neuron protein-like isoform X2 n=1 Tax=Xiphias gladius TaxID=8245 RepID=UPI001A9A15C7|nr:survival motor neuron protein-like isoform X2 [Xiphias gladius]
MTEPTEIGFTHGAAEPVESDSAAVKDQTSLVETFENTLAISQDVTLTECVASEETDSREKPEQDDRQQDGDGDGQSVCPPAAETSPAESKWVVGAQCRAVWSEDGRVYPATVVSLDGERCRVRFNGYGNEEDVDLCALKTPKAAPPRQRKNSLDWNPGSRCRAVYSEDGLVYPAVVLWVKGQRCRVRFDDYNNEEEQDVSSLLNPDELHGPSRAANKGSSWRSSSTSSNFDRRRGRREENQGERGVERRSAWRDAQQNFSWWVKERPSNQSKVEREAEERRGGNQQRDEAEKPTNSSFSLFPPFPPPQSSSGDPLSFIPPPPPLWSSSGGSAGVDDTSNLLMLWYMCGFHTGSYMIEALQEVLEKLKSKQLPSSEKKLGWLPSCDAGEQCAVRKGSRIGKLCGCPRGTVCNFNVLKCL